MLFVDKLPQHNDASHLQGRHQETSYIIKSLFVRPIHKQTWVIMHY